MSEHRQGGAPAQRRVYGLDEQDTVLFHGRPIVAVRLDDGRIAVTIQSLAEGMGLNTQAQVRRAQRTEAIAGEVVSPWLETVDAGPQEVPALVLDVLPGWLMGIDTRRVKGEAHDTILAYQREAYGVLYRHFVVERRLPELAPPEATAATLAPVDAQQVQALAEQIDELSGVVAFLREHLAALLAVPEQVQGLAVRLDTAVELLETLAARQDSAEGQIAQIAERTQRLTPAHARAVQEQVNRMVRETAHLPPPAQLTYPIIYGRLKHRFRAGSYAEIADERYEAVMAFLQGELHRATGGEGPEQGSLF